MGDTASNTKGRLGVCPYILVFNTRVGPLQNNIERHPIPYTVFYC